MRQNFEDEEKDYQQRLEQKVLNEQQQEGDKAAEGQEDSSREPAITTRLSITAHFDQVNAMCSIGSKSLLVSASSDCLLRVWDISMLQ
jgi:WD40 repeat protein